MQLGILLRFAPGGGTVRVELLSTIIGSAEADVACAESVQAALELLRRFQPEVVVSDVGMPGEDGHSFMRKLRKLAPHALSGLTVQAQ